MKTLLRLPVLLLVLFLSFSYEQAFADAEPVTLDGMKAAAQKTDDRSRKALVTIFGAVVLNPLSGNDADGKDNLFSSVAMSFNSSVLVIAAFFVMYYVLKVFIRGAREGKVNDDISHWGALRLVMGFGMIVPLPNGWNIAQLVMLWAASIIGVGSANLATDAAITSFGHGKGMVLKPVTPDTLDLARGLFLINLCWVATNADYDRIQHTGLEVEEGWKQKAQLLPDNTGFTIRSEKLRKSCGGVRVDKEKIEKEHGAAWWKILSSVDTSGIHNAHITGLNNMQKSMSAASSQFMQAYLDSKDNTRQLPDPSTEIYKAAQEYENTLIAAFHDKDGDLVELSSELSASIKQNGWWMLGAWYQTFAQANNVIASAVSAKAKLEQENPSDERKQLHNEVLLAYHAVLEESNFTTPLSMRDPSVRGNKDAFKNSPLQKIAVAMALANPDWTDSEYVNPLIRMKNVGDVALDLAGTLLAAKLSGELMSKVGPWIPYIGAAVTILGDVLTTLVTPYVFTMVLVLALTGIMLAVYIPFAPFIVWFGAIVNWLVVVIEAVVAAPLWALAHLLGGGADGMGQRSMHGYLFLLQVMLRPTLMVIGFFAAGAVLVVAGTFLNQVFSTTLANVQYDSYTGIFMTLGIIFVYSGICLTLVHNCFNLVFIIPDQVIAWVGGHASTAMGRDADARSKAAFMAAVGRSEGSARDMRQMFRDKKAAVNSDAGKDGMKG